MSEELYDLIVIGAGPGGYVAAIRAAQLGMSVAVVEKRSALGGVCLNEGCIPSKALLDSSELFALARDRFAGHGIAIDPPRLDLARMMARKDDVVKKLTDGVAFLFKKNKIARVQGTARLTGERDGAHGVDVEGGDQGPGTGDREKQTLRGKRVLLATGSEAAVIPFMPFDGELVVSAREALSFDRVPEHLLVVGAGYVGLELGSVWRRLGSQVTVVEMLPKMLPNTDGQVADTLMGSLKKQGIVFRMETKVTGFAKRDGKAAVTVEAGGATEEIVCDRVLVAAGRRPLTAGLGLEELGVRLEAGRIAVDDNYQTSLRGIYAIGDLIHGPMLAHKAMAEGEVFAERLTGQASVVDYAYIPGIVYTWPEAAGVGRTEEELKTEGVEYRVGKFPFMANGRAKCMDETEGFVKILATPDTGRVLGIHVIGPRASDVIAEAVTVMTYGGSAADIAMTFHAHPTLAEAMKEAALDVEKRAIHA
ncbi:dihydrolipoamide dehydrogenase [Geobacter metallireducens RCH3]|uniref:Dihydrolipoyl dehydrogenase n=1 Tax=Geobacter metallireducens (strain ATCC 53774 / DSM 7210 / GS-15) TaxID=269799 RepID=Q39RZ2_GEOMG|nr:dihydrolipoyl dehydrogenase [Geobacter metallireducens]ABB32982.1 dihydrolipoamide dehydrogenase [Geobacter metallireducens GS-15]EHP88884.1 dihydrolipoamide dehydrogenase [Geobacter metallireducens RCH3]